MSSSALFLSVLTVFCWGLGAFFDKLCVSALPPKAVFFARLYLFIILFLAPMVLAWEETRLAVWKADRRIPLYLLGTAAFTMAGMYLYYHALSRAEASKVVPFCAVYPLIAFALAAAFLKEPWTLPKLAGTLMVVAGAALLSRP